MKAAHSSGTPSTRQRPKVEAVVLERFPSVHEQGSCELIGRPFDAASELGLLLHPGVVPRVQVLVSDGVRHHPPLPRRADTLGPFHQNAGMHLLEHVRRPPSPSRPGRLAAVSSSTWLKAFAGTVVSVGELRNVRARSPVSPAESAGTMLLALYLLILRATIAASCVSVMVEHVPLPITARIAFCTSGVRLQMSTTVCWRGEASTAVAGIIKRASPWLREAHHASRWQRTYSPRDS